MAAETKVLVRQRQPGPYQQTIWHAFFLFYLFQPTLELTNAYNQWPFQEPKLEVPTIYKAYVMPI